MDIKFQDDPKAWVIDSDKWQEFLTKPINIVDYKGSGQTATVPVEALQALDAAAVILTPEVKQARVAELDRIIVKAMAEKDTLIA